jgi:predicted small secreted protein
MKKIFLIFTVLIFLLSGCADTEQSIGTDVQDTVLYNNAYSYKDDDISFFVKERGYEFDEEYNNKSTTFSKKEILSLLQVEHS